MEYGSVEIEFDGKPSEAVRDDDYQNCMQKWWEAVWGGSDFWLNNLERDQCKTQEELKDIKIMSGLICKGMLAVLDHEVTGNSIEKLKTVKDELRNYLTDL